MAVPPTPRSYTLRLVAPGHSGLSEILWTTHNTVNRGAQAWGDSLLTLRGGLPASLADGLPDRRVILALSWLSVEAPEPPSVPAGAIVARGTDAAEERGDLVVDRFRRVLERLAVEDAESWVSECSPALTASIRADAVWVDRSGLFEALASISGVTRGEAPGVLLDLLGGADDYFAMPTDESAAVSEAKDFVVKAGNWLSTHWGSGVKSDRATIASRLESLASQSASTLAGLSGRAALGRLGTALGLERADELDAGEVLKRLKQAVGWKGRSSKGAVALQRLVGAEAVTDGLWGEIQAKLREEGAAQRGRGSVPAADGNWSVAMRQAIEERTGMPFRAGRDLIWEYAVMLDHALRRVSAAHTWIKRAEAARRGFEEDAKKIESVPGEAREWLDEYCRDRSNESGAGEGYRLRRRAIDGWEDVVCAWARLKSPDRESRRSAAKELQADAEKFGDIQLFAGRDGDEEWPCLADNDAVCVWQRDGKPDAEILKSYVAARTAEDDQARFKVPAYRHPEPLRHPVFVDFGNSRWRIAYSALEAVQDRERLLARMAAARTDKTRLGIQQRLDAPLDLRGVTLGLWTSLAGAAAGKGPRFRTLSAGRSRGIARGPVWASRRRSVRRRRPRRGGFRSNGMERPPASAASGP